MREERYTNNYSTYAYTPNKVLGLNPYGKFPERKTETVARDMIGTLKAPMSRDIEILGDDVL